MDAVKSRGLGAAGNRDQNAPQSNGAWNSTEVEAFQEHERTDTYVYYSNRLIVILDENDLTNANGVVPNVVLERIGHAVADTLP